MSEKTRSERAKFLVDQYEFGYDLGLKVVKAKFKEVDRFIAGVSISKGLAAEVRKIWDDIPEVTVREALSIENIEARRICFRYIGVDKIFGELGPELVDEQTIEKGTRVTAEGELEKFKDTYQLYRVEGKKLSEGVKDTWRAPQDFFILRCKCTSSDREYLIYIQNFWSGRMRDVGTVGQKPDAIEAVAWTITTDVAKEDIDYIIRQGDCILVKTKKDKYTRVNTRHLDKAEYLEKVRMES